MKTIYYHLILDRSGSMDSVKEETVLAFNKQIETIKDLKKEYPEQPIKISLTLFNQKVTNVLDKVEPEATQILDDRTYIPEGYTALYDAIGMSIVKTKNDLEKELLNGEAEVIIVILTDGHENASREYSHDAVSALIDVLEKSGNWKFTYLGATMDAVQIANKLNIKQDSSRAFDREDIGDTMDSLSNSMRHHFNRRQNDPDAKWRLEDEK